jgi:hypothetical protein
VHLDAEPDERVLAHEHDGVAPEPLADVLELLGPDVVGEGDEHLGVYSSRSWHSFLSYADFSDLEPFLIPIGASFGLQGNLTIKP